MILNSIRRSKFIQSYSFINRLLGWFNKINVKRANMFIPKPLKIEIYWHREDNEICMNLAKAVYIALNRDPNNSSKIGLEIPINFYRTFEISDNIEKPEHMLRIFLLTTKLVNEENWLKLIEQFREMDQKSDGKYITIEIGLVERIIDSPILGLNLSDCLNKEERLIDFVVYQCCRLLSGRTNLGVKSAAPLKLFISHYKQGNDGVNLATIIKNSLEENKTEVFFDEYIIQYGDSIYSTLKHNITDAAILAIRTDDYISRPWCQKELALARKEQRPIIVIDALENSEERSSNLLANLPTIRLNPKPTETTEIKRVTSFIGREVLRYLHNERRLNRLKRANIFPRDSKIRARPPDLFDVCIGSKRKTVFVHPDPEIGRDESTWVDSNYLELLTPNGAWKGKLVGSYITLSVGSVAEDELLNLGLSELHITDASRMVARVLLASGAKLNYGGSLASIGSENLLSALYEMIAAFNKDLDSNYPPLVNYSAWPFWYGIDRDNLMQYRNALDLKDLKMPLGAEMFRDCKLSEILSSNSGRTYTGISLSNMRRKLIDASDAIIVLGGASHGFKGLLPGILEESILAIEQKLPIYIIGGFGGAAGAVVEALEGNSPETFDYSWQITNTNQYSELMDEYFRITKRNIDYNELLSKLHDCGIEGVSKYNGLSKRENELLWHTKDLDTAISLTMNGMNIVNKL